MEKSFLFSLKTMSVILGLNLLLSTNCYAEKMDLETHNNLISKLESVVSVEKNDSMVSQISLSHRLADLYSERARLLSLEREGKGDQIYQKQIEADRDNAIKIYQALVESPGQLSKDETGTILMQMAHLHNLRNQTAKAEAIYEEIDRNPNKYSQAIWSLAVIQMADAFFLKGDFKSAEKYFNKALTAKQNPRLHYTRFRLSWTHFQLGSTQLAETELFALLKETSLVPAFREEVCHDLAIFMAANDISSSSLSRYIKALPESSKKSNLVTLATELDRKAKKRSALQVWALLGHVQLTLDGKLERQLQMTKIQYDLGNKSQLVIEIENMIKLLKDSSCSRNQDCIVAQQNFRKILTDWGRAEERLPSKQLIQAFKKYSENFSDYEIAYWGAQTSKQVKDYRQAYLFYLQSAKLTKSPLISKIFEGSLLGAIEVAELAGDKAMRLEAYQIYVELNPQGQKVNEVKYQIAHWYYDEGQHKKSRELFKSLAAESTVAQEIRIKSADLCLDSDVVLKSDQNLEEDAAFLAKALPVKKSEYLEIWRKSIINQTATFINSKASDESSFATFSTELNKLNSIDSSNWPGPQRSLMTKNRIQLSVKTKNMKSLEKASLECLRDPLASPQDKNQAVTNMAWIYEENKDYTGALQALTKINVKTLNNVEKSEHYFRIAALKELTHKDPSPEYRVFLTTAKDKQKMQWASLQLIFHSNRPSKEFFKQKNILASHPVYFSEGAIWSLENSKSSSDSASIEKEVMSKKIYSQTVLGQLLVQNKKVKDLDSQILKLAKMKLPRGASDGQLRSGIQQRTHAIEKLEQFANQSIAQKNSSLQIISLTSLAVENARLGNEILSQPVPRSIKTKDRQAYLVQVKQLVSPYLDKSQNIRQKVLELWRQATEKNSFNTIAALATEKSKPGAILALREIAALKKAAMDLGLSQDPFKNISDLSPKAASYSLNEGLVEILLSNKYEYLDNLKIFQKQKTVGPKIAEQMFASNWNQLMPGDIK